MPAADLDPLDVKDSIILMKFPIGLLKGLRNPPHVLNNVQGTDGINVDNGSVADKTDNRR